MVSAVEVENVEKEEGGVRFIRFRPRQDCVTYTYQTPSGEIQTVTECREEKRLVKEYAVEV